MCLAKCVWHLFTHLLTWPEAPRIAVRTAQEESDSGIDAAQFVAGPAAECLVDGGIETQGEGFARAHGDQESAPALTTGLAARSEHRTTSRFDTICALCSLSSSRIFCWESISSAVSTMPTAPSTIF